MVFKRLLDDGKIVDPDKLAMLRPISGAGGRFEMPASILAQRTTAAPLMTPKDIVTPEEHEMLLSGQPVRKMIDGCRVLLTPNGDCVRNLTEEEAAAITRNFQRGAFFIGQSEPIRIDPRLPVRLTLAEGDQVHFLIGETAFQPLA